jgi:uncharacterized membrane protein YphA (DoxX/SURF4 family)
MRVIVWLVSILVAAAFLVTGAMKLTRGRAELMARGQAWAESFPEPVIQALGAAEVAGALGLLLPAATGIAPLLTPLAAIGLALITCGAAVMHLMRGEGANVAPALVLAALCLFIAWARLRRSRNRLG